MVHKRTYDLPSYIYICIYIYIFFFFLQYCSLPDPSPTSFYHILSLMRYAKGAGSVSGQGTYKEETSECINSGTINQCPAGGPPSVFLKSINKKFFKNTAFIKFHFILTKTCVKVKLYIDLVV